MEYVTYYDKAVEYLINIPKFTHEPGLLPAKKLLDMLGSPERGRKVIHVAGTNGKGSVCAYINSVLSGLGNTVGLFTSPHLINIEERIRINGVQVSREMFVKAFCTVKKCEEEIEEKYGKLSFFEYLFGMAMYCFKEADVKYIVLETGLGGRLDATNAIDLPAVTIITSISFDHMNVLGNTIEEIAGEKAGIIKPGVPVVFWNGDVTAGEVISAQAERLNAPSHAVSRDNYKILKINDKSVDFCVYSSYYRDSGFYTVPFPAVYQAENAALAVEALLCLADVVGDKDITYENIAEGIKNAFWAGRFEEIAPNIVVDGAHNEDGIRRFAETLTLLQASGFGSARNVLLFAAMKDKDYQEMIELICEQCRFDAVIVTEPECGGAGRRAAADVYLLKNEFEKFTDKEIYGIKDFREALKKGQELIGETGRLYCIGSLYLAGAVMKEYGR